MSATSAAAAEAEFYSAFENGSLNDMMAIWAPRQDIVCIHPLGPRLADRLTITESWRQILANEAPRQFEVSVISRYGDGQISAHLVDEQILIPGSNARIRPVMATNIYQRIGDAWFMVAHLASIDMSEEQVRAEKSAPATRH